MSGLNTITTGQGRDLVLVHGWGMHGGVWQSLVASLAPDFRVTLIELPGHGGSEYTRTQNSLDDWSACLLRAAPKQAVWLGWSLGGQLAMNASLLAPERIPALILMASTPKFVQDENWPHAIDPEILLQFGKQLLVNPAVTLSRFLALQVQGAQGGRETLKQLKQSMQGYQTPGIQALKNGLKLLFETDLRSSLAALQPPSLWLQGGRDTLIPAGLAGLLPQLLPAAEIHLLDKAGHAPFLSHPHLCNERIREFIDAL